MWISLTLFLGLFQGVQGGTGFSGHSLFCPSISTVGRPTKVASVEAFNNLGRAVAKALPLQLLGKQR